MNSELNYSFWDILKAPRLAISGKSLLVQARALLYGYVIYLLLTYIALLIDGVNFDYIWRSYFLFPFFGLDLYHWYAKLVWAIALIQLIAFFYYGAITVSKLAFEELKGEPFFARRKAAKFARENLRIFWAAIGLLLILVIILALLETIAGLVALIPVIGQVLYALIYLFPLFLWSLFVVFLAFCLTTAVLSLPAIVTAGEKDSFGATFNIVNIIWAQPLRWVSLTAISIVLAKIGMFVMTYFFMRSLQLTNWTSSLFSGDSVRNLLVTGQNMLSEQRSFFDFLSTLYPGSKISFDFLPLVQFYQPSTPEQIGGFLIAISLILVALVILSYGLNTIYCGQLITFILIRFHQDNEKLTEPLKVEKITPEQAPPVSDSD